MSRCSYCGHSIAMHRRHRINGIIQKDYHYCVTCGKNWDKGADNPLHSIYTQKRTMFDGVGMSNG